MRSIYDFRAKDADGKDVELEEYRGKVLLIVNTATQRYSPTTAPEKIASDIEKLL